MLLCAKIRGQLSGAAGTSVDDPAASSSMSFLTRADEIIAEQSKSDLRGGTVVRPGTVGSLCLRPAGQRSCVGRRVRLQSAAGASLDRNARSRGLPYWDNTDAPSEVSDADWRERGTIWSRALGRHLWSKAGVIWEAEIPSPTILFAQDEDGFLARVATHIGRLKIRRKRELVRWRLPDPVRVAHRIGPGTEPHR